jgi:hypothetical protein
MVLSIRIVCFRPKDWPFLFHLRSALAFAMPSAWGGGASCKCGGVVGCPQPRACCKRQGQPAKRALRQVNGSTALPHTHCLACLLPGLAQRQAPQPPAAKATAKAQAKGKAAAKAKTAPSGVLPTAVPPAPAPLPAAPVTEATLAAHTAALAAHRAALDRNTEAMLALERELRASRLRSRSPPPALPADAQAQASADPRRQAPSPSCPEALRPLKATCEEALRPVGAVPRGADILSAARWGSDARAWAQLRALLVVCFPSEMHRVHAAELQPERPQGENAVRVWLGQQQCHQAVVSGFGLPCAILNHVARRLAANDLLRQRHGARLLKDVSGL